MARGLANSPVLGRKKKITAIAFVFPKTAANVSFVSFLGNKEPELE